MRIILSMLCISMMLWGCANQQNMFTEKIGSTPTSPFPEQIEIQGPRLPVHGIAARYAIDVTDVRWTLSENDEILVESLSEFFVVNTSQLSGEMSYNITAVSSDGKSTITIIPISFIYIPSGAVKLGDNSSQPLMTIVTEEPNITTFDLEPINWSDHTIAVQDFFLQKYETTMGQYAIFVRETGHRPPARRDDGRMQADQYRNALLWHDDQPPPGKEMFPVELVSREDCKDFARWAGLRLPTEAEWEWAASGPDDLWYPWGNTYSDISNLGWNGEEASEAVGSNPGDVSPFGVFDMGGNLMEWVEPVFYPDDREIGRDMAIIRGGSWGWAGLNQYTYSRFIMHNRPWFDVGCRLAMDVEDYIAAD